MKSHLSVLVVSALLLTGCSFEPEREYDPIEMQVWQSCIDAFTDENAGNFNSNEKLIDGAVQACKKLTPRKY